MASLVERLRVRSERRPLYDDDSDDDFILHKRGGVQASSTSQKLEKVEREDAKEDTCHACGESGEDLYGCGTCTYAFHRKCLLPPLKFTSSKSWSCSECVSTLTEVEKILDRQTCTTKVEGVEDASKQSPKKTSSRRYLVKWKGLSYIHCTWIPEKEFIKAFKAHPRLRSRVNNFNRLMDSNEESVDDWIAIRLEWTIADRILASRLDDNTSFLFSITFKWWKLMAQTVIEVGMTFEGCFMTVKRVLTRMEGVDMFDVILKVQKVAVKGNVEPQAVLEKVSKTGKKTEFWRDVAPATAYAIYAAVQGKREDEKEYFVKWKELPYDECSWEVESDILAFQPQIERFRMILSRAQKSSSKHNIPSADTKELKGKQNEFQQYGSTPGFLHGGTLHPYQLEGLNFLRYSWSKNTHVILADEMGLGKTIQSIAFLSSLFEERITPHLVVAPLSTLRNWEREFATWAPQLNVIMYFGSAQARSVIRQYEFYLPKQKNKKNKRGKVTKDSKGKKWKIKFDVLLTSYEMINMDSSSLKPIKWKCMIVDEGHRLKNKDSKLFLQLKLYSTHHRVLLTGTPLQNNLDELFMLMHFLDAGKFSSLEDFQEEFKDISQEEQISRLHKMLSPHLLRRVKKDVMKDLPPKKELILRVDLTSKQKEYYRAILTRNYQILARRGGAQISLINVVMELRKLCCHTYMLEGVEPETPAEDPNEGLRQLLDFSGKMQLLDKMMRKLKEQGHRVLIYSQFQHMLDLLEDYLSYKKWSYERIDGKIGGAERQIRIDRFNARNSPKFCFLLSTRAGGLGINLATADTVIIYDSDWNPHADLQAMARAHRLGQTNKVMIYRLITRDTIEERMMQLTKKKMILEHLVVGRLKAQQTVNQEELDDIIRYGSKELFADENDEFCKARQIHYDDAAIDRLLDRQLIKDEVPSIDEEEDSDFLKAFKVANFEYVDESEVAAAKEVTRMQAMVDNASVSSASRMSYWEELLKDRYEEFKIDEFTSMGKGKRSRKQMVASEDDELASQEDVSSDEDYGYEDDLSDSETGRRSQIPRKRTRVENLEPLPLMEGGGKSLRVFGFNESQRAAFVKILMRFGLGDFNWSDFVPRLKGKNLVEIRQYGALFMSHIVEEPSDSPNFLDGVPKEGLRISDVLVRIATLQLIRDKVRFVTENHGTSLFPEDFLSRFPMFYGRSWKQEHDILLLKAMLRHGYARWQAIVEDKDFGLAEVVRQELNLHIPSPTGGGAQMNGGVSDDLTSGVSVSQMQGGSSRNDSATAGDTVNKNSLEFAKENQSQSILYQLREMQRRMVEFIKKRVLLLEKNINAEEYLKQNPHLIFNPCDLPCNDVGLENLDVLRQNASDPNINMSGGLHPLERIVPEVFPSDSKADRLAMVQLYNEMCKVVEDNTDDAVQAFNGDDPASARLRTSLHALEVIYENVHRVLAEPQESLKKENDENRNW